MNTFQLWVNAELRNKRMDGATFLVAESKKNKKVVFKEKKDCLKVNAKIQLLQLESSNQALDVGFAMDTDLNLQKLLKTETELAFYHLKKMFRTNVSAGSKKTHPWIHL